MPIRDFDAERAERGTKVVKEPIQFRLGGELFTCLEKPPPGLALRLVAGVQTNDRGDRIYSAPDLLAFVSGCLRVEEELTVDEARERGFQVGDEDGMILVDADDRERFENLMFQPGTDVQLDDVGEVAMYLAEQFGGGMGGRPFRRSGRS